MPLGMERCPVRPGMTEGRSFANAQDDRGGQFRMTGERVGEFLLY